MGRVEDAHRRGSLLVHSAGGRPAWADELDVFPVQVHGWPKGSVAYDTSKGVVPKGSGAYPLRPGEYEAVLRLRHKWAWVGTAGSVRFEVVVPEVDVLYCSPSAVNPGERVKLVWTMGATGVKEGDEIRCFPTGSEGSVLEPVVPVKSRPPASIPFDLKPSFEPSQKRHDATGYTSPRPATDYEFRYLRGGKTILRAPVKVFTGVLRYQWTHNISNMAPERPVPTVKQVRDPDAPVWAYLQFRLRKVLGDLIHLYMDFETLWTPREMDVGDQTWWMGFWPDYYLLTGDKRVRDYVYRWRDAYVEHLQSDGGRFHHGYVKYGDIDHQNEDLVRLFMRLWLMDGQDPKNRYALEEMAEHLGNWVPGIPEWYDWQKHIWKSFWLGTERIGKPVKDNGYGFNWMLVLCLESYLATGNRRYLDLAKDWTDQRIRDIKAKGLRDPSMRAFIGRSGGYAAQDYVVPPWHGERSSFRLAECLADALLDMYRLLDDPQYAETAGWMLDQAVPDIFYHGRANQSVPTLCHYRRMTGDTRFDARTLAWLRQAGASPDRLAFLTWPARADDRRYDWFHAMRTVNAPFPSCYNMAFLITGDVRHLNRAMEMAIDRVRAIYSEQSVPATRNRQRGDWNFFNYILAWEVADVFFPTVGRQYGATNCIADVYEVRFFRSDGDVGLPDTVAALYSPKPGDLRDRSILLYNAADEPQLIKIVPVSYRHKGISRFDTDAKATLALDRKSLMVELPRKRTVSVKVRLEP